MVVNNNQEAWISIGELNRNIKDTVREFEKIVTGQKINSALDDPFKHALSEKMRTKLRALEQNQANAKAGIFMLNIAEEGIEEQLNILKTIKKRATEAVDPTSTDEDRVSIQKEIDYGLHRINDIAYEIEHRGINLLTGNVPMRDTTIGWQLLLTPQVLEDSDMHLIDDIYFELDGLSGPFDVFNRYHSIDTNETKLLGNAETVNHSGGTDGTSAVFKMDFSGKTVNDLIGKAFHVHGITGEGNVTDRYYGIIDSSRGISYTTRRNTNTYYTIDIAGLDMNGALNAIASKVNGLQSSSMTAQVDGTSIKFTSKNTQYDSNYSSITSDFTNDYYEGAVTGHEGATATGLNLNGLRTSGGADAQYERVWVDDYTDPRTDEFVPGHYESRKISDATRASLSFDASGAADGSGITFNGMMIKFVTDPNDENYNSKVNAEGGVTKIGLGWSGTLSSSRFSIRVNQGQFTITASSTGAGYNNYGVGEGFNEVASDPGTLVTRGFGSLSFDSTRIVDGVDGARATYDIDLTQYNTTDAAALEEFIGTIKNHSLHIRYRSAAYSPFTTQAIEFLDKRLGEDSMDYFQKLDNATFIDLNTLRSTVGGSTTIADAFINLVRTKNSRFTKVVTDDRRIIMRATSSAKGTYGNADTLNTKENQFSHYTLDFNEWARTYGGVAAVNPMRYLNGKGFRFYCATDTEHWFNFVFTSGEDEDIRPAGISGAHFETDPIDISSFKDDQTLSNPAELAKRLAEIVYDQGNDYLVADDHNLFFSKELEDGKLTIYDRRREDVLLYPNKYLELRSMGAKIGDGILDDVQKTTVTVPANQRQLAIQHTDYSSQYITLHIPQTTINHIFGLDPDWPDYTRLNITTQAGRDYLVGKKLATGNHSSAALDKGISYLFDTLTLVRAQNSMLRYTDMQLFTDYQTQTAADSIMRDVDLAKAYVAFTSANMLAKASHTMLAQANQNAYSVMDLINGSTSADDEKKKVFPVDKKADDKSSDKKNDDKKSADRKSFVATNYHRPRTRYTVYEKPKKVFWTSQEP